MTAALFLFTGLLNSAPLAFAQLVGTQVQGENPSGLLRLARDREIWIPPELGFIEESFHGTSGKTILYIQDAHDSLEAQENISKIIDHLVTHDGVKIVLEEGYEGPVPTDKYFGFIKDPKMREKISYFLMDHLRVGGAEYAHINRTRDFNLVGADSLKLHKENIAQYRLSASKKDAITKDLKALEKEVKSLADRRFPKGLKAWLKTKEQFDAKKLDLFTYLGRTMPLIGENGAEKGFGLMSFILEAVRSNDLVVIEKAKHIDAREVFSELIKLEQAVAETYLHEIADKQLFEYYKILSLLNRLNDLQVSQEEYEAAKASLEAFDTDSLGRFIFSQTPKTLILSRMWERNIEDAVRFYEIAAARDNSIAKYMDEFLAEGNGERGTGNASKTKDLERQTETLTVGRSPSPAPAMLVYGGFHKENIKRIFEAKGISYLIVRPRITQPSPRHEEFYKRLMADGRLSYELPVNLRMATRAESRIEVWDRNTALAKIELGIMVSVVRDMANVDSRSLGLAMEQALNTFASHSPVRSEIRTVDRVIATLIAGSANAQLSGGAGIALKGLSSVFESQPATQKPIGSLINDEVIQRLYSGEIRSSDIPYSILGKNVNYSMVEGPQAATERFKEAFPQCSMIIRAARAIMKGEDVQQVLRGLKDAFKSDIRLPAVKRVEFKLMEDAVLDPVTHLKIPAASIIKGETLYVYLSNRKQRSGMASILHELCERLFLPIDPTITASQREQSVMHTLAMLIETSLYTEQVTFREKEQFDDMLEVAITTDDWKALGNFLNSYPKTLWEIEQKFRTDGTMDVRSVSLSKAREEYASRHANAVFRSLQNRLKMYRRGGRVLTKNAAAFFNKYIDGAQPRPDGNGISAFTIALSQLLKKKDVQAFSGGQERHEVIHEEEILLTDSDGNSLVSNNNVPASKARFQIHRDGDWHRAVWAFMVDRYGRLVLWRRGLGHEDYPGALMTVVRDHVRKGESPEEATARCVKEKFGALIDRARLERLTTGNGIRSTYPSSEGLNNEYADIFFYYIDNTEIEDLLSGFSKTKADDIWFIPLDIFETFTSEHPEIFASTLKRIRSDELKEYYEAIRVRAIQVKTGTYVSKGFSVDFRPNVPDEVDKIGIKQLFNNSVIINKTVGALLKGRANFRKNDIGHIEVELFSSSGTMRDVFLVRVFFREAALQPVEFIMKITKETTQDFETVKHETQNKILAERLGQTFYSLATMPDNRIVSTLPRCQGLQFDEVKDDYNAQVAVIREATRVWRDLGRFFIIEPHRLQFVVDMKSFPAPQAHLIDLGHIRLRPGTGVALSLLDQEGERIPMANGIDLHDLGKWLMPMPAEQFLQNLIDNLEVPPPGAAMQKYQQEALEAYRAGVPRRNTYMLNRRAIVQGVVEALGLRRAADFFITFFERSSYPLEKRQAISSVLLREYPMLFKQMSTILITRQQLLGRKAVQSAGSGADTGLAEVPAPVFAQNTRSEMRQMEFASGAAQNMSSHAQVRQQKFLMAKWLRTILIAGILALAFRSLEKVYGQESPLSMSAVSVFPEKEKEISRLIQDFQSSYNARNAAVAAQRQVAEFRAGMEDVFRKVRRASADAAIAKDTTVRSEARAVPQKQMTIAKDDSYRQIKLWQILQLKQDVIMVVEQSKIDALLPEMFKELLEIAGLNNGKLHLAIPDALQGKYSQRVAELRRVASVYYGFPRLAASEKIPVIGFSDMERDTLAEFQGRLDPKLAERVKDSAFGLNQAGSFGVGILYALKDIPPDQLLPNQNGFRYDATGRYSAQVLEVFQAYTVISTSA
jgi:isopentenyldiphosphate isomerase